MDDDDRYLDIVERQSFLPRDQKFMSSDTLCQRIYFHPVITTQRNSPTQRYIDRHMSRHMMMKGMAASLSSSVCVSPHATASHTDSKERLMCFGVVVDCRLALTIPVCGVIHQMRLLESSIPHFTSPSFSFLWLRRRGKKFFFE